MNEQFVGGIVSENASLPKSEADGLHLPTLSAALALDLALQSDTEENLCKKYDINPAQFNALVSHPAFLKVVSEMRNEINERGVSFRMKAAVQADMFLEDIFKMVRDSQVPASTRLTAIQSMVKWANLEPKPTTPQDGVGGFKLVINMPGAPTPLTVEATPALRDNTD